MNNKKFKNYAISTLEIIKKWALNAKKEADNPKNNQNYAKGVITGYCSIINLFKYQSIAFCIDQKQLGLADIKPDVGLLGLHRNPDIEKEEDSWIIGDLNKEKIRGYLNDTILLLKEQAIEAKKEAGHPKVGSEDYSKGELKAYYEVISIMKSQAPLFNLNQEDISLSDMEPDRDLV